MLSVPLLCIPCLFVPVVRVLRRAIAVALTCCAQLMLVMSLIQKWWRSVFGGPTPASKTPAPMPTVRARRARALCNFRPIMAGRE